MADLMTNPETNSPPENRRALIMAGGTGGHIFPALAVATALRARGWQIIWLGAVGGMETQLVPQHGFKLETLNIRGLRGKGWGAWLALPWVLLRALLQAARLILLHRPDIAIGFGGYPAFAGGVMMRFFLKPLIVHEQNAVAGLSNRVLSKIATRTLFAFPSAFPNLPEADCVGNPVRADIAMMPRPEARFVGRSGVLRLLVVGGSLGAQALNEAVPAALARLPENQRPIVVHQAGAKHLEMLRANYERAGVAADLREFIDDMASEYAEADMVICRAGALTIAELAAVGCASILVPYPHAVDDHQTENARFLAEAGAAVLLPQAQLSDQGLAVLLENLTRDQCAVMAARARDLARFDVDARIVDICRDEVM